MTDTISNTDSTALEPQDGEAPERRKEERRSEERVPFVQPVLVEVDNMRLSARSTAISEIGIGLEHHFELPLGEVDVLFLDEERPAIRLRTRITWCRPIEPGRFRSGGVFISATSIER